MGMRPSSETNDGEGTQFAVDQIGHVYDNVKKVAEKIDDLAIVADNANTIINSVSLAQSAASTAATQATAAGNSSASAAASAASAAASAQDAEDFAALSIPLTQKGQANGVLPLGPDSKAPIGFLPDAVLGTLRFQTAWNAATNTPAIPAAASANRGHYYVVTVAGTTMISGIADWVVGDWIVSDGTNWSKIDNSDKVSSVNGQTGLVVLAKADVGLSNADNTNDANKPVSTAQQAALDLKASLLTLAASTGATLVGWIQAGTSAIVRTIRDKLREQVSVYDFGAVGDGVANDTAAVQAALDSLGSAGGTVLVPNGCVLLIDSDLIIPDNCALVGAKAILGRTYGAPNINLYKPRIILNRTATIRLNNSAEVRRLGVIPKNFGFSATRANVNLWTGTAFTFVDNKSDQRLEDLFIIGFEFAGSTGANTRIDRPQIIRCKVDCLNGFYLKNVYDVPYITGCHQWPWATTESVPEANDAHLKRPGAFLWLDGVLNDWAKVTDCFTFGSLIGYRVSGADSATFLGCSADNSPGTADGSIGFLIEGNSYECRLVACQAAGRQKGISIQTTDGNGRVFIADTNVWESVTSAIEVVNGDVNIVNCGLRNTGGAGNGVYTQNTATQVRVIGTKINGFSIGLKTDSTGVAVLHDQCDFGGTATPVNNPYIKSIAAADPLPLDGINTVFSVVGTTNFANMANPALYAGKIVALKFSAALFVATGGNMKLAGGSSFNTANHATLMFVCDGTTFYEVERSLNN